MEAETVQCLSGSNITVFRSLPEFARIGRPGEHSAVFLALVFENGEAFLFHLRFSDRNKNIDHGDIPFLPGSTVQPDFRLLLEFEESAIDGLFAHPMGPVRVGHISGHEDDLGFQGIEQV